MISQRLSEFLMFELFLMMGAIISERQAMIYLNPVEQADIFFSLLGSALNFQYISVSQRHHQELKFQIIFYIVVSNILKLSILSKLLHTKRQMI